MNKKIKVIMFMAISANGIIAKKDNTEEFLSEEHWNTLVALAKEAGCVIWGRITNEVVKNTWEPAYLELLIGIRKIVVSSDPSYNPGEDFKKVSSPQDALNLLESEGFTSAILSGGSVLNSSFASLDLINEIILNVESVIVADGIPVFSPAEFTLKLEHIKTKMVARDIIQLSFHVKK